MDIRRNADCLTFIHTYCNTVNTFKIRFLTAYTQAYRGAGEIAPEHAAAKRGHHRFFFVGPRKGGGGGFVHTLRTPLGYVPAINKIVYYQHLLVSFEELLSVRLSDPFALVVG